MNTKVILIKDLPNCPKGREFICSTNGEFFHSMTDKEFIEGKLKNYRFTKKEIISNPDFFKLK